MEVKAVRVKITLECTECKQRNYNLTKDKKAHPERMEVNKYCKFCRRNNRFPREWKGMRLNDGKF